MSWFALRVKSKHEKSVSSLLRLKPLPAFTPLYTACHKWADRQKILKLPLFPTYVFCEFSANERLYILQTPGVIEVVGFAHIPAPIDDAEIEVLQRLAVSGCDAEPWPSLIVGQPANIISGPLAGVTGVVVHHKGKLNLVLSVTLLKRSVLVEVNHNQVLQAFPMAQASHSSRSPEEPYYSVQSA